MKYQINRIFDATNGDEVEADSVEEALEKSWDMDMAIPSVCHQCSNEIHVGDLVATVIYNDEGDQVHNDLPDVNLRKANERLTELLRELLFRSEEIRDDLLDRAQLRGVTKIVDVSNGRWQHFKKSIEAAKGGLSEKVKA